MNTEYDQMLGYTSTTSQNGVETTGSEFSANNITNMTVITGFHFVLCCWRLWNRNGIQPL